MGGNCPVGSCPDILLFMHCWKVADPARLHRYGHWATVASLIPHDDLNSRPVPLSMLGGTSVAVGSMFVHVDGDCPLAVSSAASTYCVSHGHID